MSLHYWIPLIHLQGIVLLNLSYLILMDGLPEDECAWQLFDLNDLGKRQPLEAIDYIIRLHAGEMPEFLLKFTFKRLVPPVCHTISSFPSKNLRALGCEANHLMVDL